MAKKLEFFASMYLESVCDETRAAFLKNWGRDPGGPEDTVKAFREHIETKDYSDLLVSFRALMGAEKAVMFQARTQDDLTEETEHQSITVLASSQEEQDRMGILRSELLDFYCRHTSGGGRPFSGLLLDVKDTVRVVLVGRDQVDPAVREYVRRPCTIAYARLDYTDRLRGHGPGHVFFAFFYPEEQSRDLMGVLKHLQGFLSFRHDLKQRIEKDFNGNLFGKRTEEIWRIDWLSIEKAGAHTDSSGVNRLISQCLQEHNADIFGTLFGPASSKPEDSSKLLKLAYNILIAMYFRAVISAGQEQFLSADNLNKGAEDAYCKVGDLLRFSEGDFGEVKLRFGKGQTAEEINGAPLYGARSKPTNGEGENYSGVPVKKDIACRSKYLRAFLVDILCNIEHHGAEGEYAEVYIEDRPGLPGYLVFRNQAARSADDPEAWCRQENYKLKRSIEFDHMEASMPKGFSLGCTAHCMRWAGNLVASYSCEDGKIYFTIKLPMIRSREKEDDTNGQVVNR